MAPLTPKRLGAPERCWVLEELRESRSYNWQVTWWPSWWVPGRHYWMAMVGPFSIVDILDLTASRSFLGQCPLTLLAIISTYLLVPKQTAPQKGNVKEGSKLARIDFAGAFLLAATILLFLLPLEITGVKIPWTHPLVLVLFASSITMGVFFVYVETHWAKEPIFPLQLLRSRFVILPDLLVFLQMSAQLGVCAPQPLFTSSRQLTLFGTTTDDVYSPPVFPSNSGCINRSCRGASIPSRDRCCCGRIIFRLHD
jgi:hypothetical protein